MKWNEEFSWRQFECGRAENASRRGNMGRPGNEFMDTALREVFYVARMRHGTEVAGQVVHTVHSVRNTFYDSIAERRGITSLTGRSQFPIPLAIFLRT